MNAKRSKDMKIFALIMLSLVGIMGSQTARCQNKTDEIPTVNICFLIKNAADYQNKTIRVKATYRYGLEWSELFCSDCWDPYHRIYIDFNDEAFDKKSKSIFKRKINKISGTINVTFVGQFINSKTNSNPENPYKAFKLVVYTVERAKILTNQSPVPIYLEESIKSQTFCKTPK
jgi:hypothetical protein